MPRSVLIHHNTRKKETLTREVEKMSLINIKAFLENGQIIKYIIIMFVIKFMVVVIAIIINKKMDFSIHTKKFVYYTQRHTNKKRTRKARVKNVLLLKVRSLSDNLVKFTST